MARFEQERVEDFKISLQTFLDGMISRQKEVSSIDVAEYDLHSLEHL